MSIAETVAPAAVKPARHPLGSRANVLLTSVFGPYARDDRYGSRVMNPMELYHNQVTREQGPFSLRMFHRSWGIMMIQCNIHAPCWLLDFPTLDRFVEVLRMRNYDIIGISSIPVNVLKVERMCELVRHYRPSATIVVGGHIANIGDLASRIDADHIVRGEGVRWFREYLGEDPSRPIRHPQIVSGIGTRGFGVRVRDKPGDVAATLIPSVGCPLGCNFCSTSAMFGGKGKFLNFYQTGDELFAIMCQLEDAMRVQSFFVMDENFLLHRRRALRLLELMEQYEKAWSLYVFASANVLRSYSIRQLIELGVSWLWMGLEGEDSQYTKLKNIDTVSLVHELQSHGIHVLGSSIIGLEHHTPGNIDSVIAHAVKHNADFHQFMLYTPVPGTPLYDQMAAEGKLLDESEFHAADIHGQYIFNYRHEHIKDGVESAILKRAFQRDFEVNGPSLARIVRTSLSGWTRQKNHPNRRVRRRATSNAEKLATTFAAATWAAAKYYRNCPKRGAMLSDLLHDMYGEFGTKARMSAMLGGRFVYRKLLQEEKRMARGGTYEPPTFYQSNRPVAARHGGAPTAPSCCQYVVPTRLSSGIRGAIGH